MTKRMNSSVLSTITVTVILIIAVTLRSRWRAMKSVSARTGSGISSAKSKAAKIARDTLSNLIMVYRGKTQCACDDGLFPRLP